MKIISRTRCKFFNFLVNPAVFVFRSNSDPQNIIFIKISYFYINLISKLIKLHLYRSAIPIILYSRVHQKIKKFATGSRYDFHRLLYMFNRDMKSKICEIKHNTKYFMIFYYYFSLKMNTNNLFIHRNLRCER